MARKTFETKLCAADGILGNPPHLEGSFPDTSPGAALTKNLDIHRQYHKRVILGAGYPSRI
jgi:hypothetical protein